MAFPAQFCSTQCCVCFLRFETMSRAHAQGPISSLSSGIPPLTGQRVHKSRLLRRNPMSRERCSECSSETHPHSGSRVEIRGPHQKRGGQLQNWKIQQERWKDILSVTRTVGWRCKVSAAGATNVAGHFLRTSRSHEKATDWGRANRTWFGPGLLSCEFDFKQKKSSKLAVFPFEANETLSVMEKAFRLLDLVPPGTNAFGLLLWSRE